MEPLTIVPLVIPHVETTMPVALLPIQQTKSKKEFTFLLLALGILWLIFLGLLFCPPSSRNHTKENLPQLLDTIGTKATVDSIKIPQVAIQTQDAAQHFIKDTLKVTSDSLDKFKNESVIDSVNVNKLNEQINNKPCIIIIGSFIKTSYAARLSMKVKENGYEVYRGEYGKYHRVGIQFNCFEQDLKEMLKELKKKFHPDAWVLKY